MPGLKEVDGVKVGHIDSPGVWLRALRTVLLYKTNVNMQYNKIQCTFNVFVTCSVLDPAPFLFRLPDPDPFQ